MDRTTVNEPLDAPAVNDHFLKLVRVVGVVEGISTLILFGIAMPLKYFADMPMAVRITGSIHGLLFTLFVGLLMLGVSRIPVRRGVAAVGVFGAIIPFGPFVYDWWLMKTIETQQAEADQVDRFDNGSRSA